MAEIFMPDRVYARTPSQRVLAAPSRYIQGPGAIETVGAVASMLQFKKLGVLASTRGHGAQAADAIRAANAEGIAAIAVTFGGECSIEEIERQVAALQAEGIDCLLAAGGGKCVDAGKCIAHRLNVPVIIVPTLASNDAPCSAVSVTYTPAGVMSGAEFFPSSPVAVIVDTAVVAQADERYLVAGMGDAMATWYEARVCARNPQARTILGARPTMAGEAMGELCAHTLYEHGAAASASVRNHEVDDVLEKVVEANTLLSGVGFESGGLAGAHAYAQGYTVLPEVEHRHLHGEMVAMGTIAQLMLEKDEAEATRVAKFFTSVGLPVHLGQMGLSETDDDRLDAIVDGAMSFAPLGNFPFEVTSALVKEAMLSASKLGRQISDEFGEEAYLRCMSNA